MAKGRRAELKLGQGRPLPPAAVAEVDFRIRFWPAPELEKWARATFIAEDGTLHNPDHKHLDGASLRFLWASSGYNRQGRRILGRAEQVRIMGEAWTKARQEQQLVEWFGDVPDFLITLDGFYAAECSDAEFCALVEHELYHIAHARDEFGAPRFKKDGTPALSLRAHDLEEFVGIVQRYGIGDPEGPLARMVLAAAKGPTVSSLRVAHACGTCILKAA